MLRYAISKKAKTKEILNQIRVTSELSPASHISRGDSNRIQWNISSDTIWCKDFCPFYRGVRFIEILLIRVFSLY